MISLCFALLCFAVLPTSSQAASAPAKVKNLKASSGEKMVTLKWKRVSGAAGYYIYRVNTTDNTLKKIATVTSGKTTSVKVKKLSNGTKYTFSVSAYKKSGKKKVEGKKVLLRFCHAEGCQTFCSLCEDFFLLGREGGSEVEQSQQSHRI